MEVVKDEVLERGDLIGFNEGFGGSEVFPFARGALEGVFDVTGLEGVGGFEQVAAFGEAAADAGGESEVGRLAFFAAEARGFVEGGEVGVVGEEDFGVEQIFYRGNEVDMWPVEIAEFE